MYVCLRKRKENTDKSLRARFFLPQESDINEEHLNEKLKAITEKCQAVLVHNTKLQDQVETLQPDLVHLYPKIMSFKKKDI